MPEKISLCVMTSELCHELFKGWENDPDIYMDMGQFTAYQYNKAAVDRYFDAKQNPSRVLLAIMKDDTPVGEIQLKQIDREHKECTLSIHMQNNTVKGHGYGTAAERLAVQYACDVLGMAAVNADTIIKNKRSQHVLEKVGFRYVKEENGFRYYRFELHEQPIVLSREVIMDMSVMIREIESRDYAATAAIWRDVLGYSSATDENVAKTCEKMKNDSRYRTFVADADGEVVGFVTTVETLAVDRPNGYIKMNGLAVLPQFQRRGIGKMLMDRVEQLAVERGTLAIGLASGFQRTGAHAFYESLGYRKTSFWFRKDIACG